MSCYRSTPDSSLIFFSHCDIEKGEFSESTRSVKVRLTSYKTCPNPKLEKPLKQEHMQGDISKQQSK